MSVMSMVVVLRNGVAEDEQSCINRIIHGFSAFRPSMCLGRTRAGAASSSAMLGVVLGMYVQRLELPGGAWAQDGPLNGRCRGKQHRRGHIRRPIERPAAR
jgi:hypothetical protein